MNSDSPEPWLFTSAMSVSVLSRYNCFSFFKFFFFWDSFFHKGLCWCSFPLFFWLSPFTWIGPAAWLLAVIQDPDYQSQRVTSAGLVREENTPSMLRSNSLGSQAVGLDRLCEIVHQRKNTSWIGKAVIRNSKWGVGNKSRTDPGWSCLTTRIGKTWTQLPSHAFTSKICSKQTVKSR